MIRTFIASMAVIALGCSSGTSTAPVAKATQPSTPASNSAASTAPGDLNNGTSLYGDTGAATPVQPERGMVFFDTDSAELDPMSKESLKADINWLKANPRGLIVVHGYTDDRGDASYNLTLGNARANAVREFLVANGIERSRITVVSHGETGPELPNDLERRAVYVRDRPENEQRWSSR